MATPPQDGIRVVIYDQEYRMRGGLDAQYIRKLAAFVDEKMRSVASRTQNADSLRTAILAAMNIADEYHQLLARHETEAQQMDRQMDNCNRVLDRLLSSMD